MWNIIYKYGESFLLECEAEQEDWRLSDRKDLRSGHFWKSQRRDSFAYSIKGCHKDIVKKQNHKCFRFIQDQTWTANPSKSEASKYHQTSGVSINIEEPIYHYITNLGCGAFRNDCQ